MEMKMFQSIKWLTVQAPLMMVVSMLTGKNIQEILALNVYERMVLLRVVLAEVLGLVDAAVEATDPAGDQGVALSEAELEKIIDEADDIKPAVETLIGSFGGDDPPVE